MPRHCLCDRLACRLCWLYNNHPKYKAHWDKAAKPRPAARKARTTRRPALPVRSPCRWEGPIISWCPRGNENLHVHQCLHDAGPDTCKRSEECRRCPLYQQPVEVQPSPAPSGWPIRFDQTSLWPGMPGLRFNCSILKHGDGYLFAYRNGWRGSEIFVGRLDQDFRPIGKPWQLRLRHRDANYGREDCRLFLHAGKPHVSFIGVVGGSRIRCTNQLFARLSFDGTTVEDVFSPADYPAGRKKQTRQRWEKNWSFFDYCGDLYAVYSIAPRHQVLRIESHKATLAYDTPFPATWNGGEMRGGAPPVRVGDELWSFGHDRIEDRGHRIYRTFLYTFQAMPPFAPLRYLPDPIMVADRDTKPHDQYCSAIFTGGAVRDGERWILASGEHDRCSRLDVFDHADLERRLVQVNPVPPPRGVHVYLWRPGDEGRNWQPGDQTQNVGDYLTLPILRALGCEPVPPQSGQPCLFAVGSILHPNHYRQSKASRIVVWGSGGIGDRDGHDLDIRAVRGPLTAKALGVDVPLGDPALLCPRLLKLPPAKASSVLYVRHCSSELPVPDWAESASMRTTPSEALGIVARIAAAGFVVTESLHGAILAQAYGVPWCPARCMASKWLDWFAYLGIVGPAEPLANVEAARCWWETVGRFGKVQDLEPLLRAFPG